MNENLLSLVVAEAFVVLQKQFFPKTKKVYLRACGIKDIRMKTFLVLRAQSLRGSEEVFPSKTKKVYLRACVVKDV